MENLLAYIEFTQFQQSVMNDFDEDLNDMHALIDLPDNIPTSQILLNSDGDFKTKAYDMYCKYIRIGSQYEINISGEDRNEIANVLDNKQALMMNKDERLKKQIFELFDESRMTMRYLMLSSFERFKREKQYDQVMQNLISISNEP